MALLTQLDVQESSRGQQDTIAPAGGNVLTHNIPGQQDPSDGIDQTGQWQNGDMSQGETNQALGMGGPNGLFPADFNQMLPNAMNMSVPGFPGMMSKLFSICLAGYVTKFVFSCNEYGSDDEPNVSDARWVRWAERWVEWYE